MVCLKSKIILIGGTAGSGKSTIARQICREIDITHRIGTGFIREILRSTTNDLTTPSLFTFTFRPPAGADLIENFEEQAKLVCAAVNSAIKRANTEGTSIVVEGNHLLPEYIDMELVDHFFILECSDELIRERITGKTHSLRIISNSDFENILKIKEHIHSNLTKEKVSMIKNDSITTTMKTIKELI